MEDDEKNYVISKQNKKIKELSQKIATKLSWIGIFNPQFRINEKGKPILIEVNPRAPTSLLLAIACGIDIPYILNEIMIGKNIKNNSLQKEKILLFSSKSFIQNIEKIGLVNFFKKIIHKNIIIDMVFSFGDPLPSIFFYYYLLKKLFWTSSPTIRNWF